MFSSAPSTLAGRSRLWRWCRSARDLSWQYYLDKDLLLPIENLDRHLLANPDEQVLVRHADTVIDATELGIGARPRSGAVWHRVASELRHKFGFRRAVPDSPDGACLRAWGPLG